MLYSLPKKGAELVSDYTVKDTARLLCVYEIDIDRAGLLDGSLDRGFCDLVEGYSFELIIGNIKCRSEMPGNSFSLAVRVGCKIYGLCSLCFFLELLDKIALAADIDILRCEVVFDIDRKGGFGKVTHVTLGCNYLII